MFEQVLETIRNFDRIIIHRHNHPDGDAMGSQIGLKHLLMENFPEKQIFVVGDPALRFTFMDDCIMDEIPDEYYNDALAIILDTSARKLISDNRYTLAVKTIRIDHHIFCETIADVEVTDTSYESCCGLIAELARECGLCLTPIAAKSLFTGMVTDSGRFRYDSTTAQTFELAAYLCRQPFDMNEIYLNLYNDELAAKQLRAQYTMKIQTTEHGVGYIYTTLEELKAQISDTFTVSRGMVGTMADIKGMDIWVNFTETENEAGELLVLCELRSSRYNINPIAVKYGGGGHAKASGASVADRETAMLMLADLDKIMEDGVQ